MISQASFNASMLHLITTLKRDWCTNSVLYFSLINRIVDCNGTTLIAQLRINHFNCFQLNAPITIFITMSIVTSTYSPKMFFFPRNVIMLKVQPLLFPFSRNYNGHDDCCSFFVSFLFWSDLYGGLLSSIYIISSESTTLPPPERRSGPP